jgi:hypothetical protein
MVVPHRGSVTVTLSLRDTVLCLKAVPCNGAALCHKTVPCRGIVALHRKAVPWHRGAWPPQPDHITALQRKLVPCRGNVAP